MASKQAKAAEPAPARGLRKISSETNFAVSLLLAVSGRGNGCSKRSDSTVGSSDAGSDCSAGSAETQQGLNFNSRSASGSPTSSAQVALAVRLVCGPEVGLFVPAASFAREHRMTPEERQSALQRQAALVRFREKKRRRQYQKKVRYHVRKRLAESRPRYKGRFSKPPPKPVADTLVGDSNESQAMETK